MGGSRRRKYTRKDGALALAFTNDVVPNDLLEQVFLRLPSPLHLVRAACTCRRWRSVIAADGGSFLRRFRSLHGASSAHIVGHYRVDERYRFARPPGCNPVFVPSSSSPWADAVAGQSLALDFLPRPDSGGRWELADSRSGLLLLLDAPPPSHLLLFDAAPPSRLVICDPLTRRYRLIPPSAWFHGCDFLGAFLLDGEAAEAAGACISLSNFRVTCALYRHGYGIARACAFSSDGGGRWTSGAARRSTALCGHGFWGANGIFRICFGGNTGGSAFWRIGGDHIVLALDKDAAEFSSSVLPDTEYAALPDKRHAVEYAYELPWPPRILAALEMPTAPQVPT